VRGILTEEDVLGTKEKPSCRCADVLMDIGVAGARDARAKNRIMDHHETRLNDSLPGRRNLQEFVLDSAKIEKTLRFAKGRRAEVTQASS
jgi:hypothetical protein